ncbi:MAG: hypothetical protein RRB13_12950 [bacterium]|nr:hypothetical protein [bacterium]
MRYGALFALLFWVVGCSSDQVTVHGGLVTQEVYGQITPFGGEPPMVLVRAQGATFVEDQQGRLAQTSAFLVYPDPRGRYRVPLNSETRSLDILVFKPGFKPVRRGFERSLGVASYEFDVILKTDEHWNEGYFVGLKPLLSGYITELRYKMPPKDVLYLNDWIDRVEAQLPLPQAKEK